ncbi:MAG: cobalamin biosynthesis protein, partial [Rhodospirillales bacterium]|nr:cobalamin biosynthesis protein [Rhodospirillales bacterium]
MLTALAPMAMVAAMLGLVPDSPVDPLLILLAALALDVVVGDMRPLFRVVPHPVAAFGAVIGFFERRLNREDRT